MKKSLLVLSALLSVIFGTYAQEPQGKMNVFIDYFDRSNQVPFIWAETIRNYVMEGIHNTNRVNLIDVDSRSALAIESSRREQENVAAGGDMDRLKVMTEEGANLLVNGIVTDASVTPLIDSKGEQYGYKATIGVTLKVIDPSNGTTILTKNYKVPKGLFNDLIDLSLVPKSEDEAIQGRSKDLIKAMKGFVEEAFPTVGKIVELDEVKGGKDAKSAYINLGTENGMAKGAKFEVRVKRMIGGSTSFKLVGEAEVTDVESDDLSKIKIKSGGQEIYDAFKAGMEVVVRSLSKK